MNRVLSLQQRIEAITAEQLIGTLSDTERQLDEAQQTVDAARYGHVLYRFHEIIGVPFERRDRLRRALEGIMQGSGRTVAEIVQLLNHPGNDD